MSCSSQNTAAAVLLLVTALSIIQVAVVGFTQVVSIRSFHSLRRKRNFDAPYTSTCAATSIEERGVLSLPKRSCDNGSSTALRSSANDAGDVETSRDDDDALTEEEIDESMEYLASLIKAHLDSRRNSNLDTSSENVNDDDNRGPMGSGTDRILN